jgi:phage-related holin
MKWLIYALLGIGFLIYYGFAMYYNNPFDFPKNLPSSYYLREYFFSGNKGLALFVLTLVIILTYIWDNVLKNSEALKKISLENTWIGRLKHLNWYLAIKVFNI